MNKKNKKNRIIIVLFLLVGIIGFAIQAQAADCGEGTAKPNCECGDTVKGNFTLTSDMTCTGDGLIIGADGITIDGGNHTITGDRGTSDYGIDNSGRYDSITIQNFANITNFGRGIYFSGVSSSTIQNVAVNSNGLYGIYLFSSSSNTLTGNTVNSNGNYGIYLMSNSSLNNLNNNTANSNNYGIYLYSSSSNTLTNNTTNSSRHGISLYNSSSSNTLTSNTVNSNDRGIYFFDSSLNNNLNNNTVNSNNYGVSLYSSSSNNNLTNNIISNNRYNLYDEGSNIYSENQFNCNMVSRMLTFTEVARTKNLNDTVSFDISMFNADGSSCSDCSYEITTSPSETVTSSKTANNVTGSFTVTRSGIYSLKLTITDSNSNITKRNYLFFVGDTASQTIKYYLRGTKPTHGQPAGSDAKSMLLQPPTTTEIWSCTTVIQNSPDEIPNYPLASLSGIDTYSWYKQSLVSGAYIGVQRYVAYGAVVDSSSTVSAAADYTWVNENFTGLNWVMDYSDSWYWLSLKLYGSSPYWTTFPSAEYSGQPSYADFTYQYTTTPAIKSISDENIMVLSATADPGDTGIISIVLEDFLTSYISTMDIVLSSPVRIDLSFDVWNTSAPYYKQWEEEASELGITAMHTISGFAPNNYYVVKKDGILVGLYMSDNLGKITFTCLAGSVFSVVGLDTIFQTGGDDDDDDSFCFIATATYGTPMASEVRILSQFRDKYLLTNPIGEGFVATYYKVSPRAALFIKEHPILKKAVRNALNPLIWMSEKSIE